MCIHWISPSLLSCSLVDTQCLATIHSVKEHCHSCSILNLGGVFLGVQFLGHRKCIYIIYMSTSKLLYNKNLPLCWKLIGSWILLDNGPWKGSLPNHWNWDLQSWKLWKMASFSHHVWSGRKSCFIETDQSGPYERYRASCREIKRSNKWLSSSWVPSSLNYFLPLSFTVYFVLPPHSNIQRITVTSDRHELLTQKG